MIEIKFNPSDPKSGGFIIEGFPHYSQSYPHWNLMVRSHVWRPPTDVYETEDSVIVRLEIAGMREEDFTITLDGKLLIIRGVRPDIPERRAYHQMEIRFGEFESDIELPYSIDPQNIEAIYSAGLLRITLTKEHPQHISIQSE